MDLKYPKIRFQEVQITPDLKSTIYSDPIGTPCSACWGLGDWYAECCSGRNCTCQGEPVYLGICKCCHGSGIVEEDYEPGANIASIAGKQYLGKRIQ